MNQLQARKRTAAQQDTDDASKLDEEVTRTGCYVDCFTTRGAAAAVSHMPGVDPRFQVRALDDDGLIAIVSDVVLNDFRRSVDPARDLAALERKVRAHDEVVKRVASAAPVVPLRFGPVLKSERDACKLMRHHRDALLVCGLWKVTRAGSSSGPARSLPARRR